MTDVDRRSLELRLLGPLEAFVDRVHVSVSGRRRRALLIRLALSANEVVSKERLVDDLWGDHPPPTVVKALHVLVSQLRDLLRGSDDVVAKNDDVLVARPTGYMLRLPPDSLDTTRFEHGYAAARQAFEQHDTARALAISGRPCRCGVGPPSSTWQTSRSLSPRPRGWKNFAWR